MHLEAQDFLPRWLIGSFDVLPQNVGEFKSLLEDGIGKFKEFSDGQPVDKDRSLGLFLNCKKPSGDQMGFFFGECLPNLDTLEAKFMSEVSDKIGTIRDYIQTIIIIHVFRMTTSFLTPGREPSLASQLGSESWCIYIFTLMFVQKVFLCIIETIIQCR